MFCIDFKLQYGLGNTQHLGVPREWYLKCFIAPFLQYQNWSPFLPVRIQEY